MKRRLVSLVVALIVVSGSMLTTAAYSVVGTDAALTVSEAASREVPAFASHTYRITVDNGIVYQNTYSEDGTHLHAVTFAVYGQGTTMDVALSVATVSAANKVYFVSRVEPDTITVSHVMQLQAGTIQIFFTYTNASGARVGELHNATLRSER